jgi:hypothetical protein
MIERGDETSWTHFEVVAKAGWFGNLLYGNEPWVEVAYADNESLQLNLGVGKRKEPIVPTVPEKWRQEADGLWSVPLTDVEELKEWLDKRLASESANPNYRVSGWIEN